MEGRRIHEKKGHTHTHKWTRIEATPTLLTHLGCQASAVSLAGSQSRAIRSLAPSLNEYPSPECMGSDYTLEMTQNGTLLGPWALTPLLLACLPQLGRRRSV